MSKEGTIYNLLKMKKRWFLSQQKNSGETRVFVSQDTPP